MTYHTLPDDHLRRRADYDLDLAVKLLAGDSSGDREVLRMAHTIGAIARVVDETDVSTDPETALAVARIRARLEAYARGSEAG